ncbi:MAG: helix-turn-helix domain-containing protein [Phycisphaeraceae bacterium JB051]
MPREALFGRVVYEPGSTLGPRIQDGLQLVGIESGRATIEVDQKRHELKAGWMCLLRPGHDEFFRFARRHQTRHNWCTMHFQSTPTDFDTVMNDLPFALPMTPLMASLIESGLQARSNSHQSTSPLCLHLGQSLFYAWLDAMQQTQAHHPYPSAIALAKDYIAQFHHQPILLEDIADAANVSNNHLIRLFKDHLDITPSRYLWQYRTQRGVELLLHTGLPITQIAQRVGFTTPFHYSRWVKQIHNVCPRQLREQHWKQTNQQVTRPL